MSSKKSRDLSGLFYAIFYAVMIVGIMISVFQIQECNQSRGLLDCVKDGKTIEKCEKIQDDYEEYYK